MKGAEKYVGEAVCCDVDPDPEVGPAADNEACRRKRTKQEMLLVPVLPIHLHLPEPDPVSVTLNALDLGSPSILTLLDLAIAPAPVGIPASGNLTAPLTNFIVLGSTELHTAARLAAIKVGES